MGHRKKQEVKRNRSSNIKILDLRQTKYLFCQSSPSLGLGLFKIISLLSRNLNGDVWWTWLIFFSNFTLFEVAPVHVH